MKPIFGRGPSLQLRLFLAVIISIAAIVADSRFGVFTHVRVYLSSLVSPLQYMANAPGIMLDTMSTQVQTRAGLIEQTKQQEQQLFTLRSRLLKMDHLEHENQRLRELLGSPVHKESRKMVAELLSVDSDPFSHQVLINKGALDGVYNGQPVINDQGVIGQVLHVGSTTSRVLLITDSSHGIPVRVLRNDLRAIASGSGELDKLELRNLPRNTDVQVGDLLVTSGLGGRFPEGYPVATVTRSDYVEGKPFAQVEAKPLVALDRLRYLLLLWTDKKPDVHDDEEAPTPAAAPVAAASAAGATR
ncbi:rod shape-determining protein MreC [Aeromonas sp. MR19]|jgi:rod shape-determining protein MreC|uniref:Cell shape-determining protein MreC n=1 Tax=Aeromonas bestiarum TaxID=105751 RepID=A0AAP4N8P0_9GAMM|nr:MULTISPECIES: rod shape-determining protein MreC [Aeromonas]ATL97581.1 rod shape-determining protein MreC [Aeromonas sp. CA23]EKP0278718.1 rod shape-determining protein MreC [Aeromonas bestiarum]KFN18492.1 rod shape-determining protein MreC [Aeromonas bestiarum]MCH7348806.1 rod shape-determining protein MreC [Aeromonas sp. MR7]MCH7376813.1 rod shape-determining protein MreC [Aeromonas sp. MR19]